MVVGDEDIVILKLVTPPDKTEFDALIKEARRQAKEVGLKPKAVTTAVAKARSGK